MVSFQIKGTVKHISKTQTFSSGFKKREFWLEIEDPGSKFPSTVPFILTMGKNDKYDDTAKLDKVNVNDVVQFKFCLNGRIWHPEDGKPDKCYCDLKVMGNIEVEGGSSSSDDVPPPAEPDASAPDDPGLDDMPF